ncbi:MAG: helix-turn-helix transcriptional regulator [Oscillibacter sp.]
MYLRLQDMRVDRDKRQAEVADYLGCCQQTYSRYENGKAQPTPETLEKLAHYFETSVDYLLGITDEKMPYPRTKRK